MAHQGHSIPWQLLAYNSRYRFHGKDDIADLFLRGRPKQGGELNHFVQAMAKSIEEHSTRRLT